MCRHGENIYKRKDGRYEGRYIVGKTDEGKTRFGYVYGYQYMEVRRKLAEHKTALLTRSLTDAPARCRITLREWMMHWMENEVLGSVKASSYQTHLAQINRHKYRMFRESCQYTGLLSGYEAGNFRLILQ